MDLGLVLGSEWGWWFTPRDDASDEQSHGRNRGLAPKRRAALQGTLGPTRTNAATDLELARRVQEGDSDALGTLFNTYFSELVLFALPYVRSRDAAEDLVQDVFVHIWETRTTWHVSQTVAQYFYGAVRNRALNARRHQATVTKYAATVQASGAGEASSTTDVTTLEAAELSLRLGRTVAALPERCREIFLLSRSQRLAQREIADLLGIALPTVKVQLGRAFKALERTVREYEEGIPQSE